MVQSQFGKLLEEPLRKFQISILLLVMIVVVGSLGYMMLEHMPAVEALYMTVITITTVGFGEVRELSELGRIFTIILIVLGIGAGAWAIRNGVEIVLDDTLWHSVQQRKMKKIIDNISGHYIICGFGRIGRQIARNMALRGQSFIVIEQDADRIEMIREKGWLYLNGDARQDEMLVNAGIMQAEGLVAALKSDADNVLAVLTARGLNPNLHIVARAGHERAENKLLRAGADRVVSPYAIGGHRLALAILQPTVHDFFSRIFTVEHADIDEIPVNTSSALSGKTIAQCNLRNEWGLIVVGIKKRDGTFSISPDAQHSIIDGETLIVIGPPEQIECYRTEHL